MDQRRAVIVVVVTGAVIVVLLVGLPVLRPPATDDRGAGLFEPLSGLGLGRDVRPDELAIDGAARCRIESRDELSADERAVVIPARTTCTLTVSEATGGWLALSDRNRTLALRLEQGSVTVSLQVEDVRVSETLTEPREISADQDGIEVDLTCGEQDRGCVVLAGEPPEP